LKIVVLVNPRIGTEEMHEKLHDSKIIARTHILLTRVARGSS